MSRNPEGSPPAIDIKKACLNIPVYSVETRRLKKVLIRSLTGGGLDRTKTGAQVKALSDISVKIEHGERVALIGHNGAGKSTFLRLISGIYTPSSGSVDIRCKVHPMIQKSFLTGPDLSGAQAVRAHYLMTHKNSKGFDSFLEEIIEFSELGDFIYMPMKGYSEGMSARLLFGLLTSGTHECLALDEGIGAGDARFVDKANYRLERFIRSAGTLLLASHSDELLQRFCSRGLVFEAGKLIYDGTTDEALRFYHEQLS